MCFRKQWSALKRESRVFLPPSSAQLSHLNILEVELLQRHFQEPYVFLNIYAHKYNNCWVLRIIVKEKMFILNAYDK